MQEIIINMEHNYALPTIHRAHTYKESGIMNQKTAWTNRAIKITNAAGQYPKSNGLAERMVGILSQLARKSIMHITDKPTRNRIWPMAMRHAADICSTNINHPPKDKCRIKKENMRPFLSECLYIDPDRPKHGAEPRMKRGLFACPERDATEHTLIYEIPSRINPNSVIISNQPRITRYTRPIKDTYNKTVFPKAQIIPTQKDLDQAHVKIIACIKCKSKHTIHSADAQKLKEEETVCSNFKGRQCNQIETDEIAKLNIGRKKKLPNNEKRANTKIPQVFRPKAYPITDKRLQHDVSNTSRRRYRRRNRLQNSKCSHEPSTSIRNKNM